MTRREWHLGRCTVELLTGDEEQQQVDLRVYSEVPLPLGLSWSGPFPTMTPAKPLTLTDRGTVVVRDAAESAPDEMKWPDLHLGAVDVKREIYRTTADALHRAEERRLKRVGFHTAGLEAYLLPDWMIAEGIVRAVYEYGLRTGPEITVVIVVSRGTQFDAFVFTLNNAPLTLADDW